MVQDDGTAVIGQGLANGIFDGLTAFADLYAHMLEALGGKSREHLVASVDDFRTRLFATVSYRLRLIPAWAARAVLLPLGKRVFSQDASILESQSETIRRFGGEEFASTEIDLLGPEIWRLMRSAERDGPPDGSSPDPVFEKSVRMTV